MNDHVLYSDEVVVGRFLNEKDILSGRYSRIYIHPMRKQGDCHSNENGLEPGANVSWFKTHNATRLRDRHPNTSLRNFGIVIGIDRHQH